MYRGAVGYQKLRMHPLFASLSFIVFSFVSSLAAVNAVYISWVPAIIIGLTGILVSMVIGFKTYRARNVSARVPSLYYWRGVMWVSALGLLVSCVLYLVAMINGAHWTWVPQAPYLFTVVAIAYGLRTYSMPHEFDAMHPPI